jgi:hypothetical protein
MRKWKMAVVDTVKGHPLYAIMVSENGTPVGNAKGAAKGRKGKSKGKGKGKNAAPAVGGEIVQEDPEQ